MAFPTAAQLNFLNIGQSIGLQDLMSTNTVQQHAEGSRVKGKDVGSLGYGECEFIYLKGVASTAAGDLVLYDPVGHTTTRTVAASRGLCAVAMSANVASQWGWYMIQGRAPVNTTAAGTGAANTGLATTATAGQATVSGAAAQKISGIRCITAQDTPTVGFTQCELSYPCANGDT